MPRSQPLTRLCGPLAALLSVPALLAAPPSNAGSQEAVPFSRPADEPELPPRERPMTPMRFYDLELEDGFWRELQRLNARRTVYHLLEQCRATGRIANFERAAGREAGPHQGLPFDDSDFYKTIEACAYALHRSSDDFLAAELEGYAQLFAAAQRPDGYLNTYYQLTGIDRRWTDLPRMHELYCVGHLVEAAVAQWEATGRRTLLDVAKRAVEHVRATFGPGKRPGVPGHPGIELALLRLYEVTGDPADLELARHFIEQRGRTEGRDSAGEYAQDHLPIRAQRAMRGHAVRATYLFAAATKLARLTDDAELAETMRVLFRDAVERHLYVTGGLGASAANEGFAAPHDLPNESGYAETCAAIGLVLWAHQMHLLDRDAAPIDVLERALYNAVRSGMSLDGRRFFYANPPGSAGGNQRQPWFSCACCPPNVSRLIGRVGDFVASFDERTVYLNLYVAGQLGASFGRAPFTITVLGDYPWDGSVQLWVVGPRTGDFTLALRIPDWCEGAEVTVNGQPFAAPIERGYARIARTWEGNDTVRLELPMPVRTIAGDERVSAQRDRFALARGPLVYCVEAVDSAPYLRSLVFDPGQRFEAVPREILGGIVAIDGSATRPGAADASARSVPFQAIPFFAWENRGPGPMLVWLPAHERAALPQPDPSTRVQASHCHASDSVDAVRDGLLPEEGSAGVFSFSPRFTWWPRTGTTEWIEYAFDADRTIEGAEIVWFDDLLVGGACAAPASIRLLVPDGETWREIAATAVERLDDADGAALLRRTLIRFEPTTTRTLRLECRLREGRSAGILEWRLLEPSR